MAEERKDGYSDSSSEGDGRDMYEQYEQTSKLGRNLHELWKEVDKHSAILCVCKHCGQKLECGNPAGMLRKIKDHFDMHKSGYCKSWSLEDRSAEMSTLTTTPVNRKRKAVMDDFVVRDLTTAEQQKFDLAIAKFFFVTGLPFNKIGHESLLTALQILRTNVTLPNRNRLGGDLLDQCYAKVKSGVEDVLKKTGFISLTCDAWTSVLGASVINFCAVTRKGTYFANCLYSGTMSHNVDNMVDCIDKEIMKLGGYDKVGGLCTDNTKVNKLVWERFEALKPGFFAYGCICHGLHLLVHDVLEALPWLSSLATDAKRVVKTFKKSSLLWAELREAQAPAKLNALALPGDTRWGSLLKCFITLFDSHEVLLKIVSTRSDSGKEWFALPGLNAQAKEKRRMVMNNLQNKDWSHLLRKGIALLEIICVHIVKFQDDRKPLSDVCMTFPAITNAVNNLPDHQFSAEERADINKLVDSRWDFMWADAHGLAHYFDPRHRGCHLHVVDANGNKDSRLYHDVERYIKNYHPDIAKNNELLKYKAYMNSLRDSEPNFAQGIGGPGGISVHLWWEGLEADDFPQIRKLALRLFSLCASSSASERNFSTFAFIHTKLRNRLSEVKVEKLVHVFSNLKELKNAGYTERDADLVPNDDFVDVLLFS